MKFLNKLNIIIILALVFASCSDEDLGLIQSNPNGPSTDNYWVNLDRVESTIAAAYNGLLHHQLLNIQGEALRADFAYSQNRNTTSGAYFHWYNQTFDNGSRELRQMWESKYQVIFRANQVIEALVNLESDASIDMGRWTEQMAQARFLRGLMHYYLHSIFNEGSVIIRDAVPKSIDDFHKGLSTSEEVLEFFRADLQYAYDNLPETTDTEVGAYRASKGTAAAVLGTSYLYEGEYDLAIEMFEDVINNAAYGYKLADASVLFTEAGENNSEAIFELNYTVDVQTEDSHWDETSFNNRLGRYTAPMGGFSAFFVPSAWLIDAYVNEPMNTQDPRNFVDGTIRPVPLRGSAMVAVMQDTVSNYYASNWPANASGAFTSNNVGYFKKYSSHDICEHEDDLGGTGWKGGRNVTVIRLSDVYLMLAEAYLKQNNDVDGALSLINDIRDRWALELLGPDKGTGDDYDGVIYTDETLMDHIMYVEKPLELSAEGYSIRNIDMRRWGIAKKRFEDLSTEEYYIGEFTYKNRDGEETTAAGLLVKGTAPADEFVIDFEYDQAAINFIESVHSYLPIPQEEERNNNGL